jgi:hypothetical protein
MDVSELQVNDFVQARMVGATPEGQDDQLLVTEFKITEIDGNVVKGSVLFEDGVSPDTGWSFELIHRDLTMPDHVCEIEATRFDDVVVRLMGRDAIWNDVESGVRVPVENIKYFTVLP